MSNKDATVMALKPDMILVPSPESKYWKGDALWRNRQYPNSTAQAKADGEFNVLTYNRDGKTYTKNKYGRKENANSIPAIAEFVQLMKKRHAIRSAVFKVEMYARDVHGRPLRVSDFIHYLKGKDHTGKECQGKPCYRLSVSEVHELICLGFFDLVEIDGRKVHESFDWILEEMCNMLGDNSRSTNQRTCPFVRGTKRVHVLPFQHVSSRRDIELSWKEYKKVMGFEGLVIRDENTTYKMKPEIELDAVVVALQKNDGYSKQLGTSLRCALMTGPNTYLEIGDVASGINHELRGELWKFKEAYPLDENAKLAYVEPLIVLHLVVNDVFHKQMPQWKLVNGKRIDLGMAESISMRHPRIEEIRDDKEPTPKEVGLNQIPQLER